MVPTVLSRLGGSAVVRGGDVAALAGRLVRSDMWN